MFHKKSLLTLPVGLAMLAAPLTAGAAGGSSRSLDCPAGTTVRQVKEGRDDKLFCTRGALVGGAHDAEGPYKDFHPNGQVRSEGQYARGMRVGTWRYYDAEGHKTGETEFQGNGYHGRRVEFFANGQLKSEEHYVQGKREGLVKTFNEKGEPMSALVYKADRVVGEQAQAR